MTKKYNRSKPIGRDVHREVIAGLPEFQAGERFTVDRVAEAIGKTTTCAGHVLRTMVDEGLLTQRAENNRVYYTRPLSLIRSHWGVTDNQIRIGLYWPQECAA